MSKLCSNAANCGIKKIQNALPESLKTKVLQSLNISTYVFVIKNKEQAKKLLSFLEEQGFSNISIDSKGTTITAQSQNAGNDNYANNISCNATKKAKTCVSFGQETSCNKHYIYDSDNGTCKQCEWIGTGNPKCRIGMCNICPN